MPFVALKILFSSKHDALQALQEQGYVVIDGALSTGACREFQQEILSLKQRGKMHLNSTHLVRSDGQRDLLQKHSVHEAEMGDPVRLIPSLKLDMPSLSTGRE